MIQALKNGGAVVSDTEPRYASAMAWPSRTVSSLKASAGFPGCLAGVLIAGTQGAAGSVFATVSRLDLTGDTFGKAIDLGTEITKVARLHRIVERLVEDMVGGQVGVLRRRAGMILRACGSLQMQHVDRHTTVFGFKAHLLRVEPRARQRIVTIHCTRIGDEHDVAPTEFVPVDRVERLHHTRIGILIEALARHPRWLKRGDLGHEILAIPDRDRVRIHLADVFEAGYRLGARAVGHEAELHPVEQLLLFDSRVDLADRIARPIDIGSHGDRRIDHEHHRRGKALEQVLLTGQCRTLCVWRILCLRRFLLVRRFAHRGDLQGTHPEAFLGKHFFGLQHRQQVEVFLDVDRVIRLF